MVYVIDTQNRILFKVDAWMEDCIEQAKTYIEDNNLVVLEDRITAWGDMVIVTR